MLGPVEVVEVGEGIVYYLVRSMYPAILTAKKALSCTTLSEANHDSASIFESGPTISDVTAQVTLELADGPKELAQTGYVLLYGKSEPAVLPYTSVKRTWTGRWQFVVSVLGTYCHELGDLVNHILHGQTKAVVFPQIVGVDLRYPAQQAALLRLVDCVHPPLRSFVEEHVLPSWLLHATDSPTIAEENLDRTVAYQFPIEVSDSNASRIPLLGIERKNVAEVVPISNTSKPTGDAEYFLFSVPVEMPERRWPVERGECPFELVKELPEGYEKHAVQLVKAPSLPSPSDVSGVLFDLKDPELIAAYEAFFDVYQVWLTGSVYNRPLQIGGYAQPLQDSVFREAEGFSSGAITTTTKKSEKNRRTLVSGLTDPECKARISIGTAIAYVLAPTNEAGEVEWVLAQAVFQNT